MKDVCNTFCTYANNCNNDCECCGYGAMLDKVYQQGRAYGSHECYKIVAMYDDSNMSLDDVKHITDGILKELEYLKENYEK